MQVLPAAQPLFAVQAVRQMSPAASQVYAPHEAGTTARQVPLPLHVRADIEVAPAQVGAPHAVPLA